jgi:hypothetical protein
VTDVNSLRVHDTDAPHLGIVPNAGACNDPGATEGRWSITLADSGACAIPSRFSREQMGKGVASGRNDQRLLGVSPAVRAACSSMQ